MTNRLENLLEDLQIDRIRGWLVRFFKIDVCIRSHIKYMQEELDECKEILREVGSCPQTGQCVSCTLLIGHAISDNKHWPMKILPDEPNK